MKSSGIISLMLSNGDTIFTMLQKNIDKENRKNRPMWNGYYTRKTPTKKQLKDRIDKKHKQTTFQT